MGVQVLSAEERAAVEEIVGARVTSADLVWERAPIVRFETVDGPFIAKRPGRLDGAPVSEEARTTHRTERAALEFLATMPDSPAPRFVGAGNDVDILVMEHLPPAPSVADLLLADDRQAAEAGVIGLADVLARVHAWSADHEAEYDAIRSRLGLSARVPRWSDVTAEGIEQLLATAATLRVPVPRTFTAECEHVVEQLRGGGWWRGLVHGDPCPDNTSVVDGRVRIFDFEYTAFGSVVLDATYVVAPFPTCWCFGRIPQDLRDRAVAAYRRTLATTRPEAGDDDEWRVALGAALSSWVLARGAVVARAIDEDGSWGTTTMRPRLLQWMDAYLDADAPHLPAVTDVIRGLRSVLGDRWTEHPLPDYPSLPTPGDHPAVELPAWFTGWSG